MKAQPYPLALSESGERQISFTFLSQQTSVDAIIVSQPKSCLFISPGEGLGARQRWGHAANDIDAVMLVSNSVLIATPNAVTLPRLHYAEYQLFWSRF